MVSFPEEFDRIAGPFYDTAAMTRWWRVTSQELLDAVDAGDLIGCQTDDGQWLYPLWQFADDGTVDPDITLVWKALRATCADSWACALWMRREREDLDGMSPELWIRGHRPVDDVLMRVRATDLSASR